MSQGWQHRMLGQGSRSCLAIRRLPCSMQVGCCTQAGLPHRSQPYLSCLWRQVQRVDPSSVSIDLSAQEACCCLVQPNLPISVASSHDPVPQLDGGAGAAGHRGMFDLLPSRLQTRTPGAGAGCPPPATPPSLVRHQHSLAGHVQHHPPMDPCCIAPFAPRAYPKAGILLSRVNSSPALQTQRVPASSAVTRSPAPSCEEQRWVSLRPGTARGAASSAAGSEQLTHSRQKVLAAPVACASKVAAKQSQSLQQNKLKV